MKTRFLTSCAVAALFGSAAHAAPETPAVTAAATAPKPAAGVTTTAADPDPQPDPGAPVAGDIIVTAQRRNESLQKVPLTIQAFTGETLSQLNVTTFNDLLKYTPNVTYGNNGPGQGAIFLRGLSAGFGGNQSSASAGNFPNVALYLDDQSMQFPARNADVYVADLERVEVLEGPQGTLFGGGAEAGAVRYITNKPQMDKFERAFRRQRSVAPPAAARLTARSTRTINMPDHRRQAGNPRGHLRRPSGRLYQTMSRAPTRARTIRTITATIISTTGQQAHGRPAISPMPDNMPTIMRRSKKELQPGTDYIGGRISAKLADRARIGIS